MKNVMSGLMLFFFISSTAFGASKSNLTDFIKGSDGTAEFGGRDDARHICEQLGLRLPTIRELAEDATAYGAEIKEVSQFRSEQEAEAAGFTFIDAKSQFRDEQFYYSNAKYKRPPGDIGMYPAWSASRNNETEAFRAIYTFFGDSGKIDVRNFRDDYANVRCFKQNLLADVFSVTGTGTSNAYSSANSGCADQEAFDAVLPTAKLNADADAIKQCNRLSAQRTTEYQVGGETKLRGALCVVHAQATYTCGQ